MKNKFLYTIVELCLKQSLPDIIYMINIDFWSKLLIFISLFKMSINENFGLMVGLKTFKGITIIAFFVSLQIPNCFVKKKKLNFSKKIFYLTKNF